jgi:hypothetical protein
MKVRDVIKLIQQDGWYWRGREAAIASIGNPEEPGIVAGHL